MKLYNSLTRTRDEFLTHEPGKCTMYTCGPTVYHFAHIGNLRTYIMEDILDKYLRYTGLDVTRCMNITDVGHLSSDADTGEDKMLKGAKREHKSVMEIAQFYTEAFFEDCRKLNIRKPEIIVPATSYIPQFIEMVQTLLDKNFAYIAEGNVYFDTSKLKEYYVFNKHDAEDLEVGVRDGVEEDKAKRNKTDFVLWFTKSKFDDQELKWESPWGLGYPGWHIECSAISVNNLGEYLDLHCGGIDNAFPHHTNEIAQSEAYLGHEWCSHWFHVLHLNTATGKMSKSSGEFLVLSLLEEKGYSPMVYRLFCLQSHYRKNLVFSWEAMDSAKTAYSKLITKIAGLNFGDNSPIDNEQYAALKQKFTDAMDNDLNTSLAITAIYDVLKAKTNDSTKIALIDNFDTVLSLSLIDEAKKLKAHLEEEKKAAANAELVITCLTPGVDADIRSEVEALIKQRAEAKKSKDFASADALRDKLTAMGITLKDGKNEVSWEKN
ncbi:MAG: cysteine--tRNA ligase [Eubacteriales bacterium]